MQVINNQNTLAFDVDDTLIMWEGASYTLNEEHAQQIYRAKNRGQFVLVWSRSPISFIERVIKEFNLGGYIDLVMQKPEYYFDDRKADEWMYHCYKGVNPNVKQD